VSRWATVAGRADNYANAGILMPLEGQSLATNTGTVQNDTTVLRNAYSTSSVQFATGASSSAAYMEWRWGLQGNFGWYTRIYAQLATQLPGVSSGNPAWILAVVENLASFAFYAQITAAGKVQLRKTDGSTDTQIGSDSALTIQVGRWYRFELYGKFGASAGQCEAGLVIAADDEVSQTVATQTGITLTTNMLVATHWGIVNPQDAGYQVNVCDIAINNDQGSSQNTYPGKGQVFYSIPTGDSARGASWTGGGGGTTNLAQAVDTLPPTGVADGSATDSTQIKNANTADTTGNYDALLQTYLAAQMPPGKYIKVAQSVAVVGSSTATDVSGASTIVANPAQAAEDTWATGRGAAIGTYGTNWRAVWGTAQLFSQATAPNPAVAPVVRIGRRGTEAGSIECCFLAVAFEVDDAVQAPTPRPVIFPRATLKFQPWMRARGGGASVAAATTPVSTSADFPIEAAAGVQQTSQMPDESTGSVQQTGSMPEEATQPINTTDQAPIEANQGVASTDALALEALQGLAATGTDPVEAVQAIATSKQDPIEATQSIAVTGNADPVEAAQGVSSTDTLVLEALQGLLASGVDPVEALQAVAATKQDPIEATQSIASTSGLLPIEALQGLLASGVAPVEALAAILQSGVFPVESVAPASTTATDPIEAAQGVNSTDAAVLESLQGIAAAASSPIETLRGILQTGALPLEALQATATTALAPYEALQGLIVSGVDPVEALSAVLQTGVLPLEALGGITSTDALPIESSGLTSVSATASLQIEALAGVGAAPPLSIEALAAIAAAATAPVEAAAGVLQALGVPLEAAQQLGATLASMPVEQLHGLLALAAMPIESAIAAGIQIKGVVVLASAAAAAVLLAAASAGHVDVAGAEAAHVELDET